jgi:hypothetical protein
MIAFLRLVKNERTMKMLRFTLLVVALILGAGTNFLFAAASGPQADSSVFQDHLVRNQLATHWDGAPTRIESEEIRRAYGDRHFYFTFKAAPLPPGAQLPELIDAYKQAMQEYQKHSLRITVGIDNKQHADTFRTAQDFNLGLMPVKTDDDARIAAAAILSLMGDDQVHPGAIGAREVSVTRTQSGWTCLVTRSRAFDGKVIFDSSGRCMSATKNLNYIPPMPP